MSSTIAPNAANKAIFPDGLKTSGQHNPIYSELTPPSEFPKEITGPTVWQSEDYREHPERWTHAFSEDEIAELGHAADEYLKSGKLLTAMAKVRLLTGVACECSLIFAVGSVANVWSF